LTIQTSGRSCPAADALGEPDAISDSPGWFAVRVRDHHEVALAVHLGNYCAETFLPLYRSRRVWSDRSKDIDMPFFPHYVFCRFRYRERVALLRIPGVYSVVSFGRDPARIPDEEIGAIRSAVTSGVPCRPWPFLKSGAQVTVQRGPLRNLSGIVIQEKGEWRLVLSIQMLRRSVAVEVDREDVSPVFAGSPRYTAE
jgi:transcription antitermination factor NusG